jgi:hypothetical protein
MILQHYRPRHMYLLCLSFFLLASCGRSPTITLPTAYIVRAGRAATPAPHTPSPLPTATLRPESTPAPLPSTTPELDPSLGPPLDQYRAWMQEARAIHPYSEPLDLMWQVMLCESSGQAEQVADIYYGLFQYQQSTWVGDWNPYRAEPILDPRAQIFATAKAWQDGNQHWWGCYK